MLVFTRTYFGEYVVLIVNLIEKEFIFPLLFKLLLLLLDARMSNMLCSVRS